MSYTCKQELYEAQEAHRQRNKRRVYKYLSEHPCVDCGNSDVRVLDFDHVRGIKSYSVGRMINGSTFSWKRIYEEIQKCEVRCANCHRIKTYNEFGWAKHLITKSK